MAQTIGEKFRREIWSFYALIVMNIVVGAIAMGISMSYGVQNILSIVKSLPIVNVIPAVSLAIIAGVSLAIFGIAIRWLLTSTETFSEVQDIREGLVAPDSLTDSEGLTSKIVQIMAYYREKKSKIQRMALVSKVAGTCFIAIGILGIINALFIAPENLALSVVSASINFAIGGAALYIPLSFSKFSYSWEYRLHESAKVEKELDRLME